MPRIPDVTQLARVNPNGQAPIAREDTRFAGAGLESLSGVVGDIRQARNNNQLAKARADLLIKKSEIDSAAEKDQDYKTLPQRYESQLSEQLGEIAGQIEDPSVRAEFVTQHRVTVAEGLARARSLAAGQEKDHERAGLQERLDKIRETGVSTGDITAANEAAQALIASTSDMGWMSEQERYKVGQDFKHGIATDRLKTMAPEERLHALKQDWAQNLPTETRTALKRQAEDESRAGRAMTIVDGYMSRGLDYAEAMDAAQRIGDAKLRQEVERRFEYDFGMAEKADVQNKSDLRDKWFGDIALGNARVDDIPTEEWDAMGAGVQGSLLGAQAGAAKGTTVPFNLEHHDKLTQLQKMGERGVPGAGVKIREYFIAHAHEMSDSQQKTWSDISIEGVMGPEAKTGLTDVQAIAAKLPTTADAERRRVLLGYMGEWRQNYIAQHQKNPSDKEREAAIDRAMIEYSTGFWSSKPVYQMTDEEVGNSLARLKGDSPTAFTYAEEYWKRKGVQPTNAQFMETVLKAKDMPAEDLTTGVIDRGAE